MQRGREGGDYFFNSGDPFDSFGGFRGRMSLMSNIFGGRDPFDDPFFNRPFGSMFGSSSPFGDTPKIDISKGPIIEELNSDDEGEGEEDDHTGSGNKKDKIRMNSGSCKEPFVEDPDDKTDEGKSKHTHYRNDYKVEGTQPQPRSSSFRSCKVTYGGLNGAYYTASTTRRTDNNGVVLEESKQADRSTGQATHRISRGIHDKGHSITRKLNSDGKVDTIEDLHNLSEEDLARFEEAWKGNVKGNLPGWNNGFNLHVNSGNGNVGSSSSGQNGQAARGGWALPSIEHSLKGGGMGPDSETRTNFSGGRAKKVVRINIE